MQSLLAMHASVVGVAAYIYNMFSKLYQAACSLQPEQVMETSEGGTPRPFLQQAQMGAPAAPGDTPVSPNEAGKGKAPGQSGRYRCTSLGKPRLTLCLPA